MKGLKEKAALVVINYLFKGGSVVLDGNKVTLEEDENGGFVPCLHLKKITGKGTEPMLVDYQGSLKEFINSCSRIEEKTLKGYIQRSLTGRSRERILK